MKCLAPYELISRRLKEFGLPHKILRRGSLIRLSTEDVAINRKLLVFELKNRKEDVSTRNASDPEGVISSLTLALEGVKLPPSHGFEVRFDPKSSTTRTVTLTAEIVKKMISASMRLGSLQPSSENEEKRGLADLDDPRIRDLVAGKTVDFPLDEGPQIVHIHIMRVPLAKRGK